jgi:hypothetical protein
MAGFRTLRGEKLDGLFSLYSKLFSERSLGEIDATKLLRVAIALLNAEDVNFKRLAYRIILCYCNRSNDYGPLYELSVNLGYAPITHLIEKAWAKEGREEKFFPEWNSAFNENYKYQDIYLTFGQEALHAAYKGAPNEDLAVVAPTSYGKSDLMLSDIALTPGNICVLVPTKALLAQTKKRVLRLLRDQSGPIRKVITHPEMYQPGDESQIAIFTQERLFRLYHLNKDVSFELVLVDEAHNILDKDERGRLLASTLIFQKIRNPKIRFRFLTPFINDPTSLEIGYLDSKIKPIKVEENIKSEKIFCIDFRKSPTALKMYDQYFDRFVEIGRSLTGDEIDFVISNGKAKNICYLNRPPQVERVAGELLGKIKKVASPDLEKAKKALAEYLHKDYFLIDCLDRGVCYHHGSVPDMVKLYIEHLYCTVSELKYIVTNSTLLEGVNIPAEALFVINNKKGRGYLGASQFKNLIGRICRFSEIFSKTSGNLKLLEPEVYVFAGKYTRENFDVEKFLSERLKVDRKAKDDVENVLLKKTKITKENIKSKTLADEFIANVAPEANLDKSIRRAKTDFGRVCFENSINEFNVLDCESDCAAVVRALVSKGQKANDGDSILEMIVAIFLPHAENSDLRRLKSPGGRSFYAHFINRRMENTSMGEMIASFMAYWRKIEETEPLVYAGSKWGDEVREGYIYPVWTNIKKKTDPQRINFAIVRIKEEQDFFDNHILKFIDVLFAFELVEEDAYQRLKFGTSDLKKIALMRTGFSPGLSSLLISKYPGLVSIHAKSGEALVDRSILERARADKVNDILRFELELNVI